MFWRDLFLLARDHAAGATRSLIIAAPFVKLAPLKALLETTAADVEVELITRWRAEEVARGVSDTEVLQFIEDRGGTVWLLDTLHAKLILVDGCAAMVGSANITGAALGISPRPNFEIVTMVEMIPEAAGLLLDDLRSGCRKATADIADSIEAAAAQIAVESLPEDPDADEIIEQFPHWAPRFRSPDRLYDFYADRGWVAAAKAGDPARSDLIALNIPPALNRDQFNARVRRRLLEIEPVVLIDAALVEPKRFGALTDVVRPVTPEMRHEERQAFVQILIRWMLYFASDLYRLDTPNYSEVLSKR